MAAASRKRPAPDDDDGAISKKKQHAAAYDYEFRSIREYELMEEVGKGSYGVVVKARDRRTGETVAVKQPRASADHRAVVREACCLAECLGHPSVVQIWDLAADEEGTGEISLVMEFVGPSLRSVLERRRRFSEAEARSLMRQLLSAARKMHDGVRMVHRDIKPANILVGAAGPGGGTPVKMCDFGAATAIRPAGSPYPEARVGTLWYRSPEQLRGERCYGPGVDMWALGCVMVEMLTGEALFGNAVSEDEVLVMAAQLRDQVVSAGSEAFNGLPEPLSLAGREVLRGLLRFDPEERLTAAEALDHRWFAQDYEAEEAPAIREAEQRGSMPLL